MTNIEADMTIRSSNGRIVFTDVSGNLQAKSNNARIESRTDNSHIVVK
ncbi:hypothetical protein QOZ98_000265 [Planomicrobium stackebrandtii]|uniref:Adhesin domain-containing protein n=1 Tax=Planomicrobium stackebrandtii TaxID=253160 RepID=A0ABU0GQ00_9BACL|nr:hypothetical protein [Planomicrobium stackebrandtii]MDQ0427440.1 hypothetical protein [Planomicrobium stackebrandtii]